MHQAHFPTLPADERKSPGGKFHSFCQNLSLALGGQRDIGAWGGGHPFDVQLRRLPPGAAVCPFHAHFAQWEFFLVHRGEGTVRAGDATHAVKPGDFFIHPPNEAHQLTNTGAGELEVLIVADNPLVDGCYYPDSNKWALRTPGAPVAFFRAEPIDYFVGEDPSAARPPPAALSTLLAAKPPPFRQLNLDELAWDAWQSPKGKFHGASKELSIALGAQRNTPTGLGGHPFDVELQKLEPGACGCPYHSHAAEWEMFILLSGTATVRAAGETHTLRAGDVVLHPPGEPHQIANGGADDLLFYIIADNSPVEYWHYPDANKWGLRQPRKFFRIQEADYWEGEEEGRRV